MYTYSTSYLQVAAQGIEHQICAEEFSTVEDMCLLLLLHTIGTKVLASDPYFRFLDGYKVKMTGKNCPNYIIKEEMHGQL